MKMKCFLLFLVLGFQVVGQEVVREELTDRHFPGKKYHIHYDGSVYSVMDASGKLLFGKKFDTYLETSTPDFFKFTKGDSSFIANPETNYLFSYSSQLNSYFPFSKVDVIQSYFSKTELIVLGEWSYLKLDGSLILDGNSYSEMLGENKKYVFKSELDMLLDDKEFWSIPDAELDEYSLKHKFLLSIFDKWLLTHPFDSYDYGFEPIDYAYSETYYAERLHVVKINKKVGIISTVGKFIVEPIFDRIEVREFEQHIGKSNYMKIIAYLGKKMVIFDQTGKKINELEGVKMAEYPNPLNLGYDFYLDGFEIYTGKKTGLINDRGDVLVPPVYENIDYFGLKDSNYLRTSTNRTLKASCDHYPFDYYLQGISSKTKLNTFYDPNGNMLNAFRLDYVLDHQRNGFFTFELDGMVGLAGPGACVLVEPNYYNLQLFKGNKNLFIADSGVDSRFLDAKGKQLYGRNFASAYFMDSNYAWVLTEEKVGLMDVKASSQDIQWLFEPVYDKIEPGRAYADVNEAFILCQNGKCGVYDTKKEVILEAKFDDLKSDGNHVVARLNGKYTLFNIVFSPCFKEYYDSLSRITYDLWLVEKNGKWAVMDVNRNSIKTPFELDAVQYSNSPNGYLLAKKDGMWGVLDSNYKWFIQPSYQSILYLYDSNEFQCLNAKGQNECIQIK